MPLASEIKLFHMDRVKSCFLYIALLPDCIKCIISSLASFDLCMPLSVATVKNCRNVSTVSLFLIMIRNAFSSVK